MISPENCVEHVGGEKCKRCGINYFDELSSIIQTQATSIEDNVYSVEATTDSVDCIIKYDSNQNTVYIALIYKSNNKANAVFLLTMKSTTGTTYGWALSAYDKIANGTKPTPRGIPPLTLGYKLPKYPCLFLVHAGSW